MAASTPPQKTVEKRETRDEAQRVALADQASGHRRQPVLRGSGPREYPHVGSCGQASQPDAVSPVAVRPRGLGHGDGYNEAVFSERRC